MAEPETTEIVEGPNYQNGPSGWDQAVGQSNMTDQQYAESRALADIMRRQIEHEGKFADKLKDYAHAFARNEQFEAMRGERMIRDQYKEQYGESMNETREAYVERQEKVEKDGHAQAQALVHARAVGQHIQTGESMPFYKALDKEAVAFARQHGTTENFAKKMMGNVYEKEAGSNFYKWGKGLEQAHYTSKQENQQSQETGNFGPEVEIKSIRTKAFCCCFTVFYRFLLVFNFTYMVNTAH